MGERLDKRIVVTGGGSGGHIAPAEAVIAELRSRFPNTLEQILYIGGDLGMDGDTSGKSIEQQRFKNSDVPFIAIRAGKLQRYISKKSIFLLLRVLGGFIDAWKELKNFKPDLVFSTGGYVTVPVCFIAWIRGIPVYIHEQTAAVGLTNRITAKFAKKIFVSFEQSKQYFPKPKVVVTGNPSRPAIFKTDGKGDVVNAVKRMEEIRRETSKKVLLFLGGSQGSHLLNTLILDALPELVRDYLVIVQTGDHSEFKDYDKLTSLIANLGKKYKDSILVTKFISSEEIGYVFDRMDLYIGRAGANIVNEMMVLNKPGIYIPIPWVTHNEQYKNAMVMVKKGLGKIIEEKELSSDELIQGISKYEYPMNTPRIQKNRASIIICNLIIRN